MNDQAKSLLKLMFDENDTICVSDSKFAYHSVPYKTVISEEIPLVSSNEKVPVKKVQSDKLILVSLNPINGFRSDANCYKFKNFLLELDYSDLKSQKEYIERLGIPISACIYSGNKSLHFLISLSKSLPSEKVYRFFSEWILNVATLCDSNCKNPSRSIRLPGNIRPDTGKMQTLEEIRGTVELEDLIKWLNLHPDSRPKERPVRKMAEKPDFEKVSSWVKEMVYSGIKPPNRNKKWFSAAVEFALSGYEESDTIQILGNYFEPEADFKEKEWKTAIKSAFKWVRERNQ